MADDKKLVREDDTTPRSARGRVVRAERDDHGAEEEEAAPRRRRRRAPSGGGRRPSLRGDVMDMQRGAMYAGIEAAAATMDIMSHLLRHSVDRAFARDYREPGDLLRGLTRDAGDVMHDAVEEAREVPQRLNDSFYDAVPRRRSADRGERHRRSQRREDDED